MRIAVLAVLLAFASVAAAKDVAPLKESHKFRNGGLVDARQPFKEAPKRNDASAKASRDAARPNYGGGKHTTNHDGHYQGGQGSSHKGGSYRNPSSGDRYGTHQ